MNFKNTKFVNNVSYILMIIFMIVLYVILLLGSQDNDMFFEIMSGRDLIKGNFSTATHLDNFPIIVQQWLYAVVLALFDKFGYIGHLACVFIQNIILVVLSVIFIKMKSNNSTKSAIILSTVSLLYCADYLINIRPQIITIILLLAELILLELYKKDNKIKYLFFIIPILILAANFHQAIFLYHILLLVPYYISPSSKYYIDDTLVSITPLFLLCSLCTPYGLDGSLYVFRTFQSKVYDLYNINELGPLTLTSFTGIKFIILVIWTLVLMYFKKADYKAVIYIFGLFFLATTSIRHTTILYIPLLFLVCSVNLTKLNNYWTRLIIASICMLLSMCLIGNAHDIRTTNYENIETVIENKDAKIYNSAMDLGGFLEYNGYTKIRIDSRCEALSEAISGVPDVNENMFTINTGYIKIGDKTELATDEYILEIIDDYDYVISKQFDYVNRVLLDNSEWKPIYSSNSFYIWEHQK